jgi:hypothetical protein
MFLKYSPKNLKGRDCLVGFSDLGVDGRTFFQIHLFPSYLMVFLNKVYIEANSDVHRLGCSSLGVQLPTGALETDC